MRVLRDMNISKLVSCTGKNQSLTEFLFFLVVLKILTNYYPVYMCTFGNQFLVPKSSSFVGTFSLEFTCTFQELGHACKHSLWVYRLKGLAVVQLTNSGSSLIRGGVEDTRLEAKDTKKIRGQGQGQPFRGQTLSRPRTRMLEAKAKDQGHKRECSPKKKKKRSSQKFFKRCPQKNVFQKIFLALHKILTIQKILLSSSRGQANFRGLEASKPRPRTWPSRPRPRTSKCVLEAKDVLEDSTSVTYINKISHVQRSEIPVRYS